MASAEIHNYRNDYCTICTKILLQDLLHLWDFFYFTISLSKRRQNRPLDFEGDPAFCKRDACQLLGMYFSLQPNALTSVLEMEMLVTPGSIESSGSPLDSYHFQSSSLDSQFFFRSNLHSSSADNILPILTILECKNLAEFEIQNKKINLYSTKE